MRFGVEYTFIADKYQGHVYKTRDGREYTGIFALSKRFQAKGFSRAYEDNGDILEVPSPPHRTLEQHKKFYDRLDKERRKWGLPVRKRCKDSDGNWVYEGTGAGHVHVEILAGGDKSWHCVATRVLWILACYPWMSWVFNEFCDNDQADAIQTKIAKYYLPILGGDLQDNINSQKHYFSCCAVNPRKDLGTVEFRMFDAPRSWRQAKEHIEFALAVVQYAKTKEVIYCPHGKVVHPRRFKKIYKREVVASEFKALCKKLGLSWKRYKKYMNNFDARLAFGHLT